MTCLELFCLSLALCLCYWPSSGAVPNTRGKTAASLPYSSSLASSLLVSLLRRSGCKTMLPCPPGSLWIGLSGRVPSLVLLWELHSSSWSTTYVFLALEFCIVSLLITTLASILVPRRQRHICHRVRYSKPTHDSFPSNFLRHLRRPHQHVWLLRSFHPCLYHFHGRRCWFDVYF